jgi:hypothetical protein
MMADQEQQEQQLFDATPSVMMGRRDCCAMHAMCHTSADAAAFMSSRACLVE